MPDTSDAIAAGLGARPEQQAELASPLGPARFEITVHIENIGDTRATPDGWGGRTFGGGSLEGFSVTCTLPGWHEHASFQTIHADKSFGPPIRGGDYCGTRGRAIPLHGFVLHVGKEAEALAGIVYQGVFEDGFCTGPLSPGTPCVSPTHAALVAMCIRIDEDPVSALINAVHTVLDDRVPVPARSKFSPNLSAWRPDFPTDHLAVLHINKSAEATIRGWALRELANWRLHQVDISRVAERWLFYNTTNPNFFLFRIEGQTANIVPKACPTAPHPHTVERAEKYREFLQSVSEFLPRDYCTMLAIGVADKVGFIPDVPVFCFQKSNEENTILLPDIEFLLTSFYEKPAFEDTIAYADKVHGAVFVGGTSGGMITPEIARNFGLPRLRAAQFFQDHPKIEFILPRIVQCVSDEAREILEKMPFCQHDTKRWKDQLTRRFIISMDGNGAACSRVAVALKSNSVLLKYSSSDILYYFHGLSPWLHYIPIEKDEDVDSVINEDFWPPNALEKVAEASQKFAEMYLTKKAIFAYTAELLILYNSCFT